MVCEKKGKMARNIWAYGCVLKIYFCVLEKTVLGQLRQRHREGRASLHAAPPNSPLIPRSHCRTSPTQERGAGQTVVACCGRWRPTVYLLFFVKKK